MLHPGLQLHGRYTLIRQLGQGGFGQTWEIELEGQIKVLKILLEDFPKAIELFQREAEVLSQLDYPGVPKTEPNSYFTFTVDGSPEPAHGYVMEKVSGVTLGVWMKERNYQPIDSLKLLDWLEQLTKILSHVHQRGFLHRDIKPDNIMLQENGILTLIDFGGVKDAAATHLQNQLGDTTGTRLASQGYTPTEQIEGHAVEQSDFFALGRTCVYLLTGKPPAQFQSAMGRLVWQHCLQPDEPDLANFVDELMAPFPNQRPQNAEEILKQLPLIRRVIQGIYLDTDETTRLVNLVRTRIYKPSSLSLPKRLRLAGLSSVVVSILLLTLRFAGALQSLELLAYDFFLRLRPLESPDPRLTIVTITDEDIAFQKQQGFSLQEEWQSIAYDGALEKLISTLESYEPRAIGLDIYLDRINQEDGKKLAESLKKPDKFITTCLLSNNTVIPQFEYSQPEQVGFSNFTQDENRVIRRHLLFGNFSKIQLCDTSYAFSLKLASLYLEQKDISVEFTSGGDLRFGDVTLHNLTSKTNAYQNLEVSGGQILLNYRSTRSTREIAKHLSLRDILTGHLDPQDIHDQIILIGADSSGDSWNTPIGRDVPGVFIHGHMISQIISAVMDKRPLIQVLSWPLEVLFMVISAVWGGSLVIISTSKEFKLLAYLLTVMISPCFAFLLLLGGWWVPIVSSGIAMVGTSALTLLGTKSRIVRKVI